MAGHDKPIFNDRERFVACRGLVKAMPYDAKLALLGMIEAAGSGVGPDLECVAEEILLFIGNDMRLKVRNEAMLLCGLDYALPRVSYAGDIVREVIKEFWLYLSEKTQTDILTRIRRGIEEGRAGDAMDVVAWRTILTLAPTQDNVR
jgi:hypothetical protein